MKKGTYDPVTGDFGAAEVGTWNEELEEQARRSSAATWRGATTAEQYEKLKDSEFGQETEEERLEREKLMEKDVIGVKIPELEVENGERMKGEGIDGLLPEEEFPRNTQEW